MPLTIVLLWFLTFPLQQQDPPAEDEQQPFRIGVDVNQVFLSVTARAIDGGFAKGLSRDDFQVLEDGVPQTLVNFAVESVPVKCVLLIDSSGSTRISQGSIRRAAFRFAESLGSEDEVAIITFNDAPRLILNWTNDKEKIQLALESIYAKGPTVMNDALYVTFDDLLKDVTGRKAVIMLTDGVDTASTVDFSESVDLAIRSEATVYVASKLDEYWAQAIAQRAQFSAAGMFVPEELTDQYILRVKRSLQRMAETTGGRILEAQAFSSLSEVYEAVAEELKNQYYLSYTPTNIIRDGKWRSIEVRVRRPQVVASTRHGYFADSQASSNPD